MTPVCCSKSRIQISPSQENMSQLIGIHAVYLDWADLPIHYHLPQLMRPLRTCSFSRPCASAVFLLPPPLHLLPFPFSPSLYSLHLPFYLPNHQFSFILQIKVGSRFIGNHQSADSSLVHNHSGLGHPLLQIQLEPPVPPCVFFDWWFSSKELWVYWLVHIDVPPMELQTPSAPWILSLAPSFGTLCSVQ